MKSYRNLLSTFSRTEDKNEKTGVHRFELNVGYLESVEQATKTSNSQALKKE